MWRQDHRAGSLGTLAGRVLTESGGVRGHGTLWEGAPMGGSPCLDLYIDVDGTGWFLSMTH